MYNRGRRHHFSGVLLLSLTIFVCRTLAGGENTTGVQGTGEGPTDSNDDHDDDDGRIGIEHGHVHERYPVAEVNWHHVETPYIISLWVLFASYAKIAFHLTEKLAKIFPESCLLIILGIVVGVVIYFAAKDNVLDYTLDSDTFFLFLLPPIVLEAGYFMPNRSFFDNIGTILLYAVVGTLFNCFCIGASLYGIVSLGWVSVPMDLLDCLVFSSLISAVDPVAVLAVFEEVHVNEVLYILVFGESLLNDAVTVVLYRMFKQFASMGANNIQAVDCVLSVTSFFIIGVAGTIVGVVWGLLTAFVTKFTDHVRVIEPLFVFVMSYLSYLTAEIFGFSGIMSIVFCGIIMKKYVEANISQKSHTTVKYFMKMLSSISETIIFMFLGLSAVRDDHVWDVAFILSTLFFCLFYRAIGVIILTALANQFRAIKVNKVEQFIMAYGGLRGAIAFSLVALLEAPTEILKVRKSLYVTTCMIVIFFTVFIQGMTIKPLVDKLKVKRSNKHKPSMGEKIFTRLLDHAMAGIEDVVGSHGHNYWRDKWEKIDRKYLQPLLLREPSEAKDSQILHVYTNLNIKDAMEYVKSAGSFNIRAGSMANFLRRSTSTPGFHGNNGSIPYNGSDICLDMHSVGGAGEFAAREVDDAELHHVSDIVFGSMHPPRKKHRYKRLKHHISEVDMEKQDQLLRRSVHLHLRHVIKQRKKKAKMANRPSHHSLNSDSGKHSRNSSHHEKLDKQGHPKPPHKNVSFSFDVPPSPDELMSHVHVDKTLVEEGSSEEEGFITFEARPDAGSSASGSGVSQSGHQWREPALIYASPVGAGDYNDEVDAPEPQPETAAESLLPWKQYSEPLLSARARQESFGALGTPPTASEDDDDDDDGGIKFDASGDDGDGKKLDFMIGDEIYHTAESPPVEKRSGQSGDDEEETPPQDDSYASASAEVHSQNDGNDSDDEADDDDDDDDHHHRDQPQPQQRPRRKRHHHHHHHHHHHRDRQPQPSVPSQSSDSSYTAATGSPRPWKVPEHPFNCAVSNDEPLLVAEEKGVVNDSGEDNPLYHFEHDDNHEHIVDVHASEDSGDASDSAVGIPLIKRKDFVINIVPDDDQSGGIEDHESTV